MGVDELLGYLDPAQAAARESSVLARENQKLRQRLVEIERDAETQVDAFRKAARTAEAAPCQACDRKQQGSDALRKEMEAAAAAARESIAALAAEKADAVQTGGRLVAEAREEAKRERAAMRDAAEKALSEVTHQQTALEKEIRELRSQLEASRREALGASDGMVAESALRGAEKRASAAETRAAFLEAELAGTWAQAAAALSELDAVRKNGEMHLRRGEQLAEELQRARELLTRLQQGDRDGAREAEARVRELAALRTAADKARDECERLRRASAGAEAERAALSAELEAARRRLGAVSGASAEGEVARRRAAAEAEAELARLGMEVARARKEAAAERERAEGRVREAEVLRAAVVGAEKESVAAKEARDRAAALVERLRAEVARLQTLLDEARRPKPPNSFGAYVALKREVAAATREVEALRQEQGGAGVPPEAAVAAFKAAEAVERAMGEPPGPSTVAGSAALPRGGLHHRASRPASPVGSRTRLASPRAEPREGATRLAASAPSTDRGGLHAPLRTEANARPVGLLRRRTGVL